MTGAVVTTAAPLSARSPARLVVRLLPLLAAAVVFGVGVSIIDGSAVGALRDDSMYLELAKALATGHGYRWLNLPGTPAATHFPPAYPADSERLQIGRSVFAVHRRMLVEFDSILKAPLGVVLEGVDAENVEVRGGELHVSDDSGVRALKPKADGRFFHVFEPNPRRGQRLSA